MVVKWQAFVNFVVMVFRIGLKYLTDFAIPSEGGRS
jgi:hypothetical protein